jgi:hypothetical protein
MATRKTLLIVDDHTLFREGLKWIRPSPKKWFKGLPA